MENQRQTAQKNQTTKLSSYYINIDIPEDTVQSNLRNSQNCDNDKNHESNKLRGNSSGKHTECSINNLKQT